MKIVYIKRFPASRKPFVIQVFKNGRMVQHESFINKPAAKEWVELNAPSAEVKDLTAPTTTTTTPRNYSSD